MKQAVVIHYGELSLKGKNRSVFEQQLIDNIKVALKGYPIVADRQYGRLVLRSDTLDLFSIQDELQERLQAVFGIANFAFAYEVQGGYEEIEATVLEVLKNQQINTFAVRAHRSAKEFEMNSQQINEALGACILQEYGGTVRLKNPELEVFILITSKDHYIYTQKHAGADGLPVGSSGTVMSLLSSGIDSPVASYQLMKRGAKVLYCHFHSYPITSQASIENTEAIVERLQQHQPSSTLFLVPLADLQKQIVKHTPSSLRVLLYRRAMLQIAERLATSVSAHAVVTGESLGQVASQTLENLAATSAGIELPIFRPLIGMNKQEIISTAEMIGTYDISILPYEDCCSVLLPDQVETKAQLHQVIEAQKEVEWEQLIQQAITETERKAV